MNSKISFFNISIVRSDFKRLWWLSFLFGLGILTFFVFPYIYQLQFLNVNFYATTNDTFTNSMLYNRGGSAIMSLSAIFPVALAVMQFSYLNSAKAVACLHGLPIKRHQFFASHIISGAILIILPILANALILLLFRFDPDIAKSFYISNLLIWIGEFILYSLLTFSFAACISMLSGNNVAAIAFCYIFAILPFLAETFINFFLDQQIYGYDMNSSNFLSDFIYVFPERLTEEPVNILKYIAFIIVFLGLAIFIYKKRNLENNCEVVAFPKLRPVFVYGVAICAGAVGYAYLNALTDTENILLLIPFGAVGIIAAEMIAKKTLKVKSAIKPLLYYIIAIFILLFAIKFDVTGFERRVPDIDKVAAVYYDSGANKEYGYRRYTVDGEEIFYDSEDMRIKSADGITNVISLHEDLIKNRLTKDERNYSIIRIAYDLKNGKTLSREYKVSFSLHKKTLEPVIESEDVRKQYFPILKNLNMGIVQLEIEDRRIKGEMFESIGSDSVLCDRLLDALKKDTKATDYEEFARRTDEMTSIRIGYRRPAKYKDGKQVPEDMLPVTYETYYIRNDYENTKALLDEIGFYSALPTADDVVGIGIDYYDTNGGRVEIKETEAAIEFSESKRIYNKAITNKDDILVAYDYLINSSDMEYSASADVYFENGHIIHLSFDKNAMDIPDVLKYD